VHAYKKVATASVFYPPCRSDPRGAYTMVRLEPFESMVKSRLQDFTLTAEVQKFLADHPSEDVGITVELTLTAKGSEDFVVVAAPEIVLRYDRATERS
jgi:hypothetical protein